MRWERLLTPGYTLSAQRRRNGTQKSGWTRRGWVAARTRMPRLRPGWGAPSSGEGQGWPEQRGGPCTAAPSPGPPTWLLELGDSVLGRHLVKG